jgi:hypothetical protein
MRVGMMVAWEEMVALRKDILIIRAEIFKKRALAPECADAC